MTQILRMDTPPTDNRITDIIAVLIASIGAFLFGHSGLFSQIRDYFFKTKEKKRTEEEELLRLKNEEILKLTSEVESLRKVMARLEKDLVKMDTYLKILLPYLETLMPDGANPFIREMAKEIRENVAKQNNE